jgi:4-diphosphocytidyl-2-C-methyl-D-erythritol kinase
MILFPNAKINIGLRVIERRTDGYHSIETLFLPIGLCDILEFVETSALKSSLKITGLAIGGNPEDNLILKAWEIMHQNYSVPSIEAHLHKIIPIGAGLGGGSADAAFMLRGLNEYFSCGCSFEELESYAAELGSDCAFFIRNSPAIGTGRGEILEPIQVSLLNLLLGQ